MIPLPFALSRSGGLRLAGAACLCFLPLAASAQLPALNKPIPTPPPGSNPAVFAVPGSGDYWTSHFKQFVANSRRGNVRLLFDGDSITDFWQGAGKEVWTKNYSRLNVADYGISGDKTQNLLWRLKNGEVAGLHPKLVVLLIGTNNLDSCTPPQVAAGVTDIVHEYQERCPSAVILLQGIFPRSDSATDPNRAKIKAVNAIISKLGDDERVVYLDFGDKFLQPDGTIRRDLLPDALHPNAAGYQVWADAIRPEIEKVFGHTS